MNDMGVDEQIESYKRQLYNYNAMVSEMVTSTAYSAEEIKEIWEDFYGRMFNAAHWKATLSKQEKDSFAKP